jgi:hypothetical protein
LVRLHHGMQGPFSGTLSPAKGVAPWR